MTRLTIDPTACDGRGVCASLLPELLATDPWGYPLRRPEAAGTGTTVEVPAALAGPAKRAVHLCPVLALRLSAG